MRVSARGKGFVKRSEQLGEMAGFRLSFLDDPVINGEHPIEDLSPAQLLVGRRTQWKPWESPVWGNLMATMMFATIGRAARGPLLSAYLSDEASGLAWRCTPVCVSGFEEAKLHAFSLYRSQVARLGGMKVWEHMIPRYHSFWGGAEPVWQAEALTGTMGQRSLSNPQDGSRSPGGGERGGRVHGSRAIAIGGEPNPGPSTACGVRFQLR